jgi:hypothetical protein
VSTPTAIAIMGWPSAEMAARYQHVLDGIRKGVADQVGACCGSEGNLRPEIPESGSITGTA